MTGFKPPKLNPTVEQCQAIACPDCRAAAGDPCTTLGRGSVRSEPHSGRIKAARKLLNPKRLP